MAKKKSQPKMSIPSPIEASTSQHAHLEGHSSAPKLHLGQKVTAHVHGTVSEIAHQYSGKGHRIQIKPHSIHYESGKASKPSKHDQMKHVRVVSSTEKKRKA